MVKTELDTCSPEINVIRTNCIGEFGVQQNLSAVITCGTSIVGHYRQVAGLSCSSTYLGFRASPVISGTFELELSTLYTWWVELCYHRFHYSKKVILHRGMLIAGFSEQKN